MNNLSEFLTDGPNGGVTNASTSDWVIPTSYGNDMAQHNGFAVDRSATSSAPFWTTNGAFSANDGVAGVEDAWSTTLQTAVTGGTSTPTIMIKLKPTVGETLTVDPGTASSETATVTSTSTASSGVYTVGVTWTGADPSFSHAVGAVVQDLSVGKGLAAFETVPNWTIDDAYEGSQFGGWLFVVVSSAAINPGLTQNQGIDDMFYSPLATGGTALICTAPYTTEAGEFGFDTALPDNGSSGEQNGTCGHLAFTNATS